MQQTTAPIDLVSLVRELARSTGSVTYAGELVAHQQARMRAVENAAAQLHEALMDQPLPARSFRQALDTFSQECDLQCVEKDLHVLATHLTQPGMFFEAHDKDLLRAFQEWITEARFAQAGVEQWIAYRTFELGIELFGNRALDHVGSAALLAPVVDVMAHVAHIGAIGMLSELSRLGARISMRLLDENGEADIAAKFASMPAPDALFWLHEYEAACGGLTAADIVALANGLCEGMFCPARMQALLTAGDRSNVHLSRLQKLGMLNAAALFGAIEDVAFLTSALDPDPEDLRAIYEGLPGTVPAAMRRDLVALSRAQAAQRALLTAPRAAATALP